jgi:hypothetical protein
MSPRATAGSVVVRRDDTDSDENDDGDGDMNYYPTSTLETTILTDEMPSPTPPPIPETTDVSTTSDTPQTSDASRTTTMDSVFMDKHCPYPYPGIHCAPNQTLVTSTTRTTTTKTVEPSMTGGRCPYPGQKC